MSIKLHLHNGYIAPFLHSPFAGLYLSNTVFAFGYSLFDLFFLLHFKGSGMAAIAGFLIVKFLCLTLFIPALLYLSQRLSTKPYVWLSLLMLIIATGAALVSLTKPVTPVSAGLIYALVSSPYWALYHVYITKKNSQQNLGNEISIAVNSLAISSFAGFICAGFLQETAIPASIIMLSGIGLMLVGNILLKLFSIKRGALDTELKTPQGFNRALAFSDKALMTYLQGIHEIPSRALWPLWMAVMGLASGLIGIIQGLTVLFNLMSSFLVGKASQKDGNDPEVLGSLFNMSGWLPWLVIKAAWLLPLSSFLWAVGSYIFNIGLTHKWYISRSVEDQIYRESILGLGRLTGLALFIPLLFLQPDAFLLAGVGASLFVSVAALTLRTRHKKRRSSSVA